MGSRSEDLAIEKQVHAFVGPYIQTVIRDVTLARLLNLPVDRGVLHGQYKPEDGFGLKATLELSEFALYREADLSISEALGTASADGSRSAGMARIIQEIEPQTTLDDIRQYRATNARNLFALTSSRPFYMPVDFGYAVMNSMPLTADAVPDLRLPFESVLVFLSKPMLIPKDIAVTENCLRRDVDNWLHGVVIDQLRPDGRLHYALAHSAGSQTEGPLWLTGRSLTELETPADRPLITVLNNIAAYVSWGSWRDPRITSVGVPEQAADLRRVLRNRSRKESQSSAARALRDAAAPVHVVDIREAHRKEVHATSLTGAHVREHDRRGHWRRSRTGPASLPANEREAVWRYVLPTTVNEGVGERREPTVWKMPYPPEVRTAVREFLDARQHHQQIDPPGVGL